LRPIYRQQLYSSLALTAVLAALVSGCGGQSAPKSSDGTPITDQNASDPMPAVFYQTTAECEADIAKQQQEYQVLLKAHEQGQLTHAPLPPT
ncbi:hypothetical protein, partial [Haemophilus parainfluenzae]|uniref:hypothetical protein n=1 Tax=Haemophilus parainfluenzae TaxID=729 RepID=UPI001CECFEB8